MKKVAIAVVVVAVLVAVFFVLRGGGGDRPAVADALPAQQTAGLGGAQALDAVARRWLPVAQLIEPSLTAETIREQAGFDPTTAEGWASVGVDPVAGVGVAFDPRVKNGVEPVPLLLVKLTDTDKALAWISARAEKPATIEGDGPVRTLKVGDQSTPIGQRKGWTVVMAAPRSAAEQARAGFEAFIADGGEALGGASIYTDAFDGADGPRVFWWGGAAAAGGMMAAFGAPETVTSTVDFYAAMFPSMAAWIGESDNGARLVATEKGLTLVRKLFVPQRRNPKVARYIGAKGWVAVRFSANLNTVLDGVGEAMPPAAAQAKAAVGMVRMMLPMAAGVNWDDISAGLSGHVVLAGEVMSLGRAADGEGMPDGLMLLGVNDEAKADALVGKLIDRVKGQVPGVSVSEVELAGEKGRAVAMGPMKLAVVRVDDVLLVGPQSAVDGALKRADGEHLGGPHADALDGDALWAAVVDMGPVLVELQKQIIGDNARNPLETPLLKPFADDPRVALTAELDGKGILWRTRAAVPLDVLAATAGAYLWAVDNSTTIEPLEPGEGLQPPPAPAAVPAAPPG